MGDEGRVAYVDPFRQADAPGHELAMRRKKTPPPVAAAGLNEKMKGFGRSLEWYRNTSLIGGPGWQWPARWR